MTKGDVIVTSPVACFCSRIGRRKRDGLQCRRTGGRRNLERNITAADGQKLGGITVSAKPADGTITTIVYTDESGNYYFPPMPSGQLPRLGAGGGFRDRQGQRRSWCRRKQGFRPAAYAIDFVRQLPGNAMRRCAARRHDARELMKQSVRNNCTGCHTASYVLQHRFDEAGWNAIIDLMKNVNVTAPMRQARTP